MDADPPTESTSSQTRATVPRVLYLVAAIPTILGVAHHVDHVVRGNHVGWPLTPEINPFTFSLVVYPLLAVGVYLTETGRAGLRYWTAFFGCSTGLVAVLHLGPWAVETPAEVIGPYDSPVAGYAAFVVLAVLIGSLAVATGWAAVRWRRARGRGSA
jgi:hypothetical protein